MSQLVFCLMGPTASGKTALAFEMVSRYPFEIISVDSAMIYRGMDIGTAKPSPAELQQVPHHLVNILNPIETYSAAQFCTDVFRLCHEISQRGKIPLLVGGTMMYFNALQKGMSALPEADPEIRQELESQAQQVGWQVLHQQLQAVDPIAAARIHAHDAQRIQRALEVFYSSGQTLSQWLTEAKEEVSDYQFVNFSLVPKQRAWLHERIGSRFEQMLGSGFVEEVQQLLQKWPLNSQMPAMRCVGYRQILEYLQGNLDYDSMRIKGIIATRQLAKRQLTWLRHWDNAYVYDPQPNTFSAEIIAQTKEILDNVPF